MMFCTERGLSIMTKIACLLCLLIGLPIGVAQAQKGTAARPDLSQMSEEELIEYTSSRSSVDDPALKIAALAEAVRSKKLKAVLNEVRDPAFRAALKEHKCFRRFVFGTGKPRCDQVPGQIHLADVFKGPYELGMQHYLGEPDIVEIFIVPDVSPMSAKVKQQKRRNNQARGRANNAEDRTAAGKVIHEKPMRARRRAQDTEYIVCQLTYDEGWQFDGNFCYFGTNGHINRYAY